MIVTKILLAICRSFGQRPAKPDLSCRIQEGLPVLFDPLRKVTGTLLGVLLAVSVSVIAAPGARALNVDVSHFTLANGLQVVVIPDHRAPVVTNMVWYRVGASDEPAGKAGIAHFLEHLLFKGTDKLAPGEFSQIVRRNGGQR